MNVEDPNKKNELSAERQAKVMELGASLHDEWRAPRKLEDGTFNPRVKVLVKTEGGDKWYDEAKVPEGSAEIMRQDIANTDFPNLHQKWQAENKSAAEVAMAEVFKAADEGIVMDELFIEKASAVIHEKWLERNSWVFDANYGNPELAKPYVELPEDEKEKDRAQVRKAIAIYRGE